MPHVALVAFTGFRVRERELLELGMTLPGLRQRGEAIGALPALGLLTLAGLTPPTWTQSWHEAPRCSEAFVRGVLEAQPDVVAVTALTASVSEAYALLRALKAHGVPTVIGGLHATALPAEAEREADAVVVGDGEPVWAQVLDDAANGALQTRYSDSQAFDLADSPLPRWDLLGQGERPRFTLQTARGCPFACEFCAASRLLGRFREKPIAQIRAELDALTRLDPRPLIELADDNTFAGERDVRPLLDALGNSGARYFTEADWRIGERPEVLERLAESGCVQVLVGIESLVFKHPGMGQKATPLSRVMSAIEAIQASGVAVNGCFIVGADGETEASMERLGDFILASPLAEVQLTLQTPFPGSGLYTRLKRAGRLLPERDWNHYTLFDVTYRPDPLTPAQLEAGFRALLARVFGPEPTRRRQAIRRATWRAKRAPA